MQAENPEEFYDVSVRNKKYGLVDPLTGPAILEKWVFFVPFFARLSRGKGLVLGFEPRTIFFIFFAQCMDDSFGMHS